MSDHQDVTAVVEAFLRAVEQGDRAGIRARHAADLLMFDFPDTVTGLDAYDAQWDYFYDSQTGPLIFAPEDLRATVADRVAFTTCLVHCDGTTAGDFRFRLTVGLEKRDGAWTIVHEHHSMPTQDEGLIMPEKRAALAAR